MVRRAPAGDLPIPLTPDDLVEETCGLCTERFADTPHWPTHRVACCHTFHYSCIQNVLSMESYAARKCPLCRTPLDRPQATGTRQPAGTGTSDRTAIEVGWQQRN